MFWPLLKLLLPPFGPLLLPVLLALLPVFESRLCFDFEPPCELSFDELLLPVLLKRLKLFERLLPFGRPEKFGLPLDWMPREKPCELEPVLPPPVLGAGSSTGRATVRLPKERMLEESELEARPLNDRPSNAVLPEPPLAEPLFPKLLPLEPLPNERIERSEPLEPELGIWNELPLRPLEFRPGSPDENDRDCIEEPLELDEPPDEKLRPDDPLLPLLLPDDLLL